MNTNDPSDNDIDDLEEAEERRLHRMPGGDDEPSPEKTTVFRLRCSNDHTEVTVERWADGSVGLRVSSMDGTIDEELTPHESLQLIAAILPDPATPDLARRKSARSPGSREEGKP